MKKFFQKLVGKEGASGHLAQEKANDGENVDRNGEESRLRVAIRNKLKKHLPWLIAAGISTAGHLPLLKHRESVPMGEPRMAMALAGGNAQPIKMPSVKRSDENAKKWRESADKEESTNKDYREERVENKEKLKIELEEDKRDLLATLEAGQQPDMQKVVFEMMEHKDQGVQARIISKAHENFMGLAYFVDKTLPEQINIEALDTLVKNYAPMRLHIDERSSIADSLASGLCDESANCDARAKDLMLAMAEHYPGQLDKTYVQIFNDHIRLAYKLDGKTLILDGTVTEIDKDTASKNKRNLILPLYEYLKSYAGKEFSQLKDVQILGPKKSKQKNFKQRSDSLVGLSIPLEDLDLDDFEPPRDEKNEESKKKENKNVEKAISKLLKPKTIAGELDVITFKKSLVLSDVEEILQSGELWRIKFADSIDDDGLKKLVEKNINNPDSILRLNSLNPITVDQAKILSKASTLGITTRQNTEKDALVEIFKVKQLGINMIGGYTPEVIEMFRENQNLELLLLNSRDTNKEAFLAALKSKARITGTQADLKIDEGFATEIAKSQKRVVFFGKVELSKEAKAIIAKSKCSVEFYDVKPDDELIELALSGEANIYYFNATEINELYAKYLKKLNLPIADMKSHKNFTPKALEIVLPVRSNVNNNEITALDLQGLKEITDDMAIALTKNPEQRIRIKKPKMSRAAVKTLLDANKFIEIELDQEKVNQEQIKWFATEYGLNQPIERGSIGLVFKNVQEMSNEAVDEIKATRGFGFYSYDNTVAKLIQQKLDLAGAKKL